MLTVLLDLVLPRSCAGCRLPGLGLCEQCRSLLVGPAIGLVRPDPCPPGLPAVSALLSYEGVAQRLLLSHKEKGRLALTRPLGRGLATAALVHEVREVPEVREVREIREIHQGQELREAGQQRLGGHGLVLCPVPSTKKAVRQRGHDHAMRLATAAASDLRARGVDARAARLLTPVRTVADQSGLTTGQRAANLSGALRGVGAPVSHVVLVDDVITTGATLVEGTRALREAGHQVLGAAVVAATTRRHVFTQKEATSTAVQR